MIMAITAQMLPMIIVPLAFLFVLLIVLINKVPKAGAWVVGGVILAAPILLYRLAMAGAGSAEAIPLLVVPASFLFVLLIIVLTKAPKAGAALVVALVVMALVGLFLALPVSHRRGEESSSVLQMRRSTDTGSGLSIVRDDLEAVHLEVSKMSSGLKQVTSPAPVLPAPVPALSPIWSEGVENEYEADVYPSKLAAVRALGQRMRRPLERVIADMNTATKILLFQDENDGALAGPFKRAIAEALPDVPCSVLFGSRNLDANEIGIALRSDHVAGSNESSGQQIQATVSASARHGDWETTVRQSFIDKPWMEDFSSFANSRPLEQFILARSWTTCTSPVEARNEALQDAATKLQQRIGKKWILPGVEKALTVGPREVEDGGFIVDLFLQSFDGVSGRFWRHALLIDASPEKLKWLDARMSRAAQSTRMSWARMGLSVIGVLVLIGAIYFFLNMATMGYYEWSLRIAGIVLAIIAIISVLMIVQ